MSVRAIRNIFLGLAAAAALLVGGVWTGRLVADPVAGHGRLSAERLFNHLADRLDLSDSQKSQVREILKSHKSAILAQLRARRDAHRALHAAIQASTFDEGAIRAKAEELGRVEGDGAVLLGQIRSEIWPVLNDEQKTRVDAFHQHLSHKGDRMIASVEEFLSSPN